MPGGRQAFEEVTRDRRASAAKLRRARALLLLSDHDRPGGRMTGPQAAAEAHRLARRQRIVHRSRSGSWLNVAEIELSILARQSLDRRIGSAEELDAEGAAWERTRNAEGSRVRWRFTTADARIKLEHLYISAAEVCRRLITKKNYTDAELPTQQTINTKLNMLGCRLTKVAKSRPQKKSRRPTPSSTG